MTGRFLAGLAAAVLALGLAAPKARAVVIYDWTGACDFGCSGQAAAVLTLADSYTPGSNVDEDDFVSFSYSSSSGTYDALPDELASVSGALPAVSGPVSISFEFTVPVLFGTGDFATFDSGAWLIGQDDRGITASV